MTSGKLILIFAERSWFGIWMSVFENVEELEIKGSCRNMHACMDKLMFSLTLQYLSVTEGKSKIFKSFKIM